MTTPFIGDTIRQLRRAKGLARLDVQRLSGLSEGTLARAEQAGTITRRTAERLAPVLGVEAEELFRKGVRP